MTATVNDRYRLGYARTFTGFWLAPNGLTVLSEQDALTQAAKTLNRDNESKS